MDLAQTWLPQFYQQFWALVKKNKWLSWRSKRSTFVQFFSSLFFILAMLCIKKTWDSCLPSRTMLRNVFDPEPLVMPPVLHVRTSCLSDTHASDFVWSGNESARIAGIVSAIMANNPGRPIPSGKVLSFGTTGEVDVWLYSNPMWCSGALHFTEMNTSIIRYCMQNPFPLIKRGLFEDPTFKIQTPLQIAAAWEIARSVIGDDDLDGPL